MKKAKLIFFNEEGKKTRKNRYLSFHYIDDAQERIEGIEISLPEELLKLKEGEFATIDIHRKDIEAELKI